MKLFKHEMYDKETVKSLMFYMFLLGATIAMLCIWLNERYINRLLWGW